MLCLISSDTCRSVVAHEDILPCAADAALPTNKSDGALFRNVCESLLLW